MTTDVCPGTGRSASACDSPDHRNCPDLRPWRGGHCEGLNPSTPCDGGSTLLTTRRARYQIGGSGRLLCGSCARRYRGGER